MVCAETQKLVPVSRLRQDTLVDGNEKLAIELPVKSPVLPFQGGRVVEVEAVTDIEIGTQKCLAFINLFPGNCDSLLEITLESDRGISSNGNKK